MRKRILVSLVGATLCCPGFAVDLDTAILNVRDACSGISDSMHDMKVKAGIGTAVTAVGTVTGGVALGAGIAKAKTDNDISNILVALKSAPEQQARDENQIDLGDDDIAALRKQAISENVDVAALEQKSKTLGNVRTGTLAASTATSVVGTALAATNKTSEDLEKNINKCISATKELADAKLVAKIENTATNEEIAIADNIVKACRDYEIIDLTPINKRATGATIASGIGIGTGMVGTITSAVANTNKTRQGDENKEKSLNTTANVMSGASAVASATATIFNATQIAAIKKVATVADICEGALK